MLTRRKILAAGAAIAVAPSRLLAQADPVLFGFSAALSGDAAAYGKPYLDAALVAAEELNRTGGIAGRPIKIVYYDDRGIPDQALQAAKKLVFNDTVAALHPGSTSGAILTAMTVGKQAKLPMWGYGLAKEYVTRGEGMIFRSAVPDQVGIGALAKFAHDKGLRRIGLLHVDHFYGESVRDTFTHLFEGHGDGAKVVITASHPDGSRDVSSQLLSIAGASIDGFYMATNGSAFAPVLRQSRQFLPENIPFMTDSELSYPSFRKELGELANGAFYYSSLMSELNDDPLNQKWIALLKTKLGSFQEIMGRAVVGMTVLKEAMERAKSFDGVAVMKEVHKLVDFPTPAGPFNYDPRDGEGLKTALVGEAMPGGDPSKDRQVARVGVTEAIYPERINFDVYFGAGYRDEIYRLKNVTG